MSSYLTNGYAERSRIEHAILQCDLSVLKINEGRFRLVIGLAECNSFRQLLALRQYTLQTRYRSSIPRHKRSARRLIANRREIVFGEARR